MNLHSICGGGYKIYSFTCQEGMSGRSAVLFWRGLGLKIRTVLLNLEFKLVILNVNSSNRAAFRQVTAYALPVEEQPDFFRCLEVFLGTSQLLMLMSGTNTILDTCLGCIGLAIRRVG